MSTNLFNKVKVSGSNVAAYLDTLRNTFEFSESLVFNKFKTFKASEAWVLQLLNCNNTSKSDKANIFARIIFDLETNSTFDMIIDFAKSCNKKLKKVIILNILSVRTRVPDKLNVLLLNEIEFSLKDLTSPHKVKIVTALLSAINSIDFQTTNPLVLKNVENTFLASMYNTKDKSEIVGMFVTRYHQMNLDTELYYHFIDDEIFNKIDGMNMDIPFNWDIFRRIVKMRKSTVASKFFDTELSLNDKTLNDLITVDEYYNRFC